jgi:hypothetical protein
MKITEMNRFFFSSRVWSDGGEIQSRDWANDRKTAERAISGKHSSNFLLDFLPLLRKIESVWLKIDYKFWR